MVGASLREVMSGGEFQYGIERDVADEGIHHRRLGNRIRPAGDDPHRVHDLAILVHVETRRGRINDDIAATARRKRARPLEVELQEAGTGLGCGKCGSRWLGGAWP